MRACNRIDQLPCDANFPRRLPHRPLEDIAHAEPSPDFLDIDRSALEGEARIARDHEQRLEARQRGDDVFDDTVGKVFLLGIATHVLERQNGDGGFVGEREGLRSLGRRFCCREELGPMRTRQARIGSAIFLRV